MKHRKAALALVAVAALAAACAPKPGAAAIVGSDRISEAQLTSVVQETLVGLGQPKDQPADQLTGQALQRLVTIALVNQLAAQEGVAVTQGEVDGLLRQYEAQAGGREQMLQTFITQNVAPSMIEPLVRLNIQASKLGQKLAPAGDANAQSQAVVDALAALSTEEGTEIAPRFGTWDASKIAIVPAADDVSVPRDR